MKPVPKSIESREGRVAILWSDGHVSVYAARDLRLGCRCAVCVDEWTHENRIDSGRVPAQIKPERIEVVGNYALHFAWSDGHDSGIYSYDYLREICGCADCRKGREFNV
jgi:prepilin-type processing-associated H-X9-DG protein